MSIKTATVDGQKVTIGDSVGFKSDIEQGGEIVNIKKDLLGNILLILKSSTNEGFSGDYIGGDTETEELASDCWID